MAKKKKEQLEEPKKKKAASKGAVKKSVVPASLPVLVPAGGAASPKAERPVVKPKKAPVKKKPVSARPVEVVTVTVEEIFLTTDEIAVRAYHLSEHRRAHGIWGDETGDWVEAERQLRAEKAGK